MQGRATQEDGMMRTQVFVGIDVSKAQLDVAFRPEGRVSVPNDEAGCAQVLERLRAVPPTLVVLEATGGLEIPLTGVLAAAGVPVVVVNPRQVRDFAKATGRLAKPMRWTPRRWRTLPRSCNRSCGPCRMSRPRHWRRSWRVAGNSSRC